MNTSMCPFSVAKDQNKDRPFFLYVPFNTPRSFYSRFALSLETSINTQELSQSAELRSISVGMAPLTEAIFSTYIINKIMGKIRAILILMFLISTSGLVLGCGSWGKLVKKSYL